MLKRTLAVFGLAAAAFVGAVQLASTPVKADPPLDRCAAVICPLCPEGYVFAPTPGNCCRCVKIR